MCRRRQGNLLLLLLKLVEKFYLQTDNGHSQETKRNRVNSNQSKYANRTLPVIIIVS